MNMQANALSRIGAVAVQYARRGWHVCPIRAGTKDGHYLDKGHIEASADPERVTSWWQQWPDANIGLSLAASGLVALDPDLYKPDCEWTTFIQGRDLPETLVQKTARGGLHYIFTAPAEARFPGKLCKGVEVKHHGYIMLAPSTFEGKPYQIKAPHEPAPVPGWVPRKDKPSLSQRAASAAGLKIDLGTTFSGDDNPPLAEIQEALSCINPDLPYDEWCNVLMALHAELGEAGLDLADRWSAGGAKYKPGEVADKFRGFKPGGGVTIRTVFAMAKEAGADLGELRRRHRGGRERPAPRRGGGKIREAAEGTDLTEDGVALAFTRQYGGTMRFDHDQGRWFEWRGDRWKPDNTHLAYSYCRRLARELSQTLKDAQRSPYRKAAFAAGVERMARADRAHAVTSEEWDTDPFLLGCPGMTIDLRTGQHLKPDAAHGITKQAAVAPARADCPRWKAFLLEACQGDQDMVRFLQQWAGYCLTGDTREHALLFVYGSGGNGKSVFLETVTHILGEYAATASMDTFTASKHSQHLTFMAMLRGARLVTASETEEGKAWAETKIKQVTGGDKITANFMRQDAFTFTPQFKLTVVGNHKPVLRNVDEAARRRFNILPFTVRPKTPDKQLIEKLRTEAPAILQWMIEGCLDWQKNGLVRPQRVLDATAEYFDDQDLTGQWLDEACRVEPENLSLAETPKALFDSWRDYAMAAGEDPGTQMALLSVLAKRGLTRDMRKIQGKKERIWRGIELLRPTTYQA
jgi:putative DNA primase/helicase